MKNREERRVYDELASRFKKMTVPEYVAAAKLRGAKNELESMLPIQGGRMERLTIREIIDHCDRQLKRESVNSIYYKEHEAVKAYLQELIRYKTLEEQGRLVVLPCKVGDTVWVNLKHHLLAPKPVEPTEAVVTKIKAIQFTDGSTRFFAEVEFSVVDPYYNDGRLMVCGASVFMSEEYGSWDVAFLTREEAEQALKAAVQTFNETPSGDCEQGGAKT